MQCVVLAGGLGRRLGSLTASTPKHLLPVAGEPFAHYQLTWLSQHGVDRVVYCVGHQGDQIRGFVGDGSRWAVRATFVDDGDALLGTGGALRRAFEAGVLDPAFLALYGDSYLSIDPSEIWRAYERSGLPALMTVLENRGRYGKSNAIYADGLVHRYDKSPPRELRQAMSYIDYGLLVLSRDVIQHRISPKTPVDLASILRDLSQAGRLAGYLAWERFYEIGTLTGLQELDDHLRAHSAHS